MVILVPFSNLSKRILKNDIYIYIYIYIRRQSDQLKIRLGKSNLQLIRLSSNIYALVFLLSTLTAVLQIN